MSQITRPVRLRTSLSGNFRLVIMEERFLEERGKTKEELEKILVDHEGNIWKATGQNIRVDREKDKV
ncbi:MAG TPA: hypothetical protein VIH61_03885 [Waddliaceae bacterium]